MSISSIIGCDEMRERNIDTSCYCYNRDPGIYEAVIDFMAESRKPGTIRVFFTFSDGRKIVAPVYWWHKYLGFYDREPGCKVRVGYEKKEDGRIFLMTAETIVDEEDVPYEIL